MIADTRGGGRSESPSVAHVRGVNGRLQWLQEPPAKNGASPRGAWKHVWGEEAG